MSLLGDIFSGISVVGGLLKSNKVKPGQIAKQIEGQALGARQAGEKYGFNPLALLGLPVDTSPQPTSASRFGQAIGDAAQLLGNRIGERERDAEISALRQQNEKLRERADRLTLRAPVPGVYQRGTNAIRSVAGVGDTVLHTALSAHQDDNPARPVSTSDNSSASPKLPLKLFGADMYPRAGSSDAEAVENRYGSVVGEFFGLSSFAGDVFSNTFSRRKADPETLRVTPRTRHLAAAKRRPSVLFKDGPRRRSWAPHVTRRFDPNHRDAYVASWR